MNETRSGGSPNRWLLLLIPVSMLMMAKARRHRMMWEGGWEPAAHGFGHHAPMGGPGTDRSAAGTRRLPPRLEAILEAWHTRAHQTTDATDATEATEPPTA